MPDESLVRFRNVVAASLAELESRRAEVNDLNVFPVADGDTGDNMAMTHARRARTSSTGSTASRST